MESLQDTVERLKLENAQLKEKSQELTWQDLYNNVKKSTEAAKAVSFKEYIKSAHPRTFNDMFNEGGDRLTEKRTFNDVYKEYAIKLNESVQVQIDVAAEGREWTRFENLLRKASKYYDFEYSVDMEGPGGGWPCVDLWGNPDGIRKFLIKHYTGGDEQAADEIIATDGEY